MKRIFYPLICLVMVLSGVESAFAESRHRASVDTLAFEAEMHRACATWVWWVSAWLWCATMTLSTTAALATATSNRGRLYLTITCSE